MDMTVEDFVEEMGGVVSSVQLAEFLGEDPANTRRWAHGNGIPLVGNAFAFTTEAASDYVAEEFDEAPDEGEDMELDDDEDHTDEADAADDDDTDEDMDDGDTDDEDD